MVIGICKITAEMLEAVSKDMAYVLHSVWRVAARSHSPWREKEVDCPYLENKMGPTKMQQLSWYSAAHCAKQSTRLFSANANSKTSGKVLETWAIRVHALQVTNG